ncbi:MAG: tRNA glutamyl-Q(34) synthetase GluQRS [Rhodospirillaceae bacterium]|jgi:glutamyl-Q tRNA(Asp) synthetase|nr:tRNA glutamyl-Q(34) synthetase GluQRS [Rhodospirillaceae bacterium]MBT4219164.1 tRNA glutamyl-Q(34) synthetase GluQRS [Rhodospirillaceae bacterium]MBT4464048.1 tRNA glutamyl-Q(34) synthetase GluQRS [Rhodospirillaceae bacterium]MBT5014018.1 tRNA glutamyl-Q(34) synthetase GluQRS [Rhodospirillaceae bacterium]MBT5309816.1 tRNA glutamyl-Q(34) synthetase GluQRS [Rhodospirillaceae bacterium]
MSDETVTRFAPSPTGLLHLGHAFSALFAARNGDRLLLRMEDIDGGRCRAEFEDAIHEDLNWLGLEWEQPVRRQSEHMDDYSAALGQLDGIGLLYPCFCTRKEIATEIAAAAHAPHPNDGPDGPLYPGICQNLSADERTQRKDNGEAFALRLNMKKALTQITAPLHWHDREAGKTTATPEIFGDVVLARKDTPTSYHLAVTVDDALQGVTLVTRGLDLMPSSHVHRLLQELLGLPTPKYHHHRLLTSDAGQRLAKRDKSLTLRALRQAGKSPDEVRKMAGIDSP